jgi:hypothetical protein
MMPRTFVSTWFDEFVSVASSVGVAVLTSAQGTIARSAALWLTQVSPVTEETLVVSALTSHRRR